MKLTRVVAASAGVLLIFSLAACGGAGTATPTSSPSSKPTVRATPSATATATPTAAPVAATAAMLLVLPGFIGVYDDSDGSIADYDYFAPIGTISSELAVHFGFAPAVTHIDADPNGDGVSFTSYNWEGFELRDWDMPASREPYIPEFQVFSSVGDVRAVSIETSGNSKVGDSTDAVAAANSDVSSFSGEGGVNYTSIRVFPMDPVNGRYGPISLAVRLDGRTGGVIESMLAPWPDMQM